MVINETTLNRSKADPVLYLQNNLTCMNEDFHCLNLRERADLIMKKGQHLVTTNFYGSNVKLYNLAANYVEVYHHPITRKVMRVSFATARDLDKHLSRIVIQAARS